MAGLPRSVVGGASVISAVALLLLVSTDKWPAVLKGGARGHVQQHQHSWQMQRKLAWVTVVSEETHPGDQLYKAYALAGSIRRYSQFPLIVFTDDRSDRSLESLQADMQSMGFQMRRMQNLAPTAAASMFETNGTSVTWSRMLALNMTDWEKIIWVDGDGIFTRSMDHLFDLVGTWMQAEHGRCYSNSTKPRYSALMTVTPSERSLQKLVAAHAEGLPLAPSYELVEGFFRRRGHTVRSLFPSDAACSVQRQHQAREDMPGYVHRPIDNVDCMKLLLALKGKVTVQKSMIVAGCTGQLHGQLWRDSLCESDARQRDDVVRSFCRMSPHESLQPPPQRPQATRNAWITMAIASKRGDIGRTYMTYALARSVQKHSRYPLVVLTDEPDKKLKADMERMGHQVHDMKRLAMPRRFSGHRHSTWVKAWNKLQMFGLTNWDRLVWLDSDGLLTRSMDYLFELPGTWSQGEDGDCTGEPKTVNSGLLLFQPSKAIEKGILNFSETLDNVKMGDQELIERYFEHMGTPVNLLHPSQAAFGKCIYPPAALPDFLHKPFGYTECMLWLTKPGKRLNGVRLPRCAEGEQSREWHQSFCESSLFSTPLTNNDNEEVLKNFCEYGKT